MRLDLSKQSLGFLAPKMASKVGVKVSGRWLGGGGGKLDFSVYQSKMGWVRTEVEIQHPLE